MHNRLGKECAHVVHVLCRSYLWSEYTNNPLWTNSYLYPSKAPRSHRPVHSQKVIRHSVSSPLIHTIHSTYKERKHIKLKLISNYTVENFS